MSQPREQPPPTKALFPEASSESLSKQHAATGNAARRLADLERSCSGSTVPAEAIRLPCLAPSFCNCSDRWRSAGCPRQWQPGDGPAGSHRDSDGDSDQTVTETAGSEPTDEPAEEATEDTSGFSAKASDFKIGIKILSKKCFGSAGCSVTYRIKPEYVGDQSLPSSGTVEVTYRVKGDESGP